MLLRFSHFVWVTTVCSDENIMAPFSPKYVTLGIFFWIDAILDLHGNLFLHRKTFIGSIVEFIASYIWEMGIHLTWASFI